MNVSRKDQETINNLMEKAGYVHQKRKYHCTFGFIEKLIPEEEAKAFGQDIVKLLQEHISLFPPLYEVEVVAHLFGHVMAFLPTSSSVIQLQEINQWLSQTVKKVSEGRYHLNEETKAPNYVPHMTIWRTRRLDARFERLQGLVKNHPPFRLIEAACVFFD
ncbi:MAG: hypothetical protein K2W92_09785 [Alphaproteobacteria bacterium]|nr:hypothetical protein [Alphaproteobacteria bacterium]